MAPPLTPEPTLIQEACSVRTFAGPDTIVESIQQFFSSARKTLHISIFKFHHKGLIEHLATLRAANPELEIKVQLDPVKHDAAGGASPEEVATTRRLEEICGASNVQMGPTVNSPRPVFQLIHQKYAVADGARTLIVTGNWDNFMPAPDHPVAGREWGIIIEGAETGAYFERLFAHDWELQPPHAPAAAARRGRRARDSAQVLRTLERFTAEMALEAASEAGDAVAKMRMAEARPPQFPEGSFPVRTRAILPVISPANYHPAVMELIDGAKRSIRIQQMYFSRLTKVGDDIVPAPDGKIQELLNALRRAFQRGVQVSVLLESTTQLMYHDQKSQELFWEFVQLFNAGMGNGIRFRHVGPDRTLTFFHNKGLVVDGEAVVVSSTNWSDFSVTLSREAGVIVRDPEVAGWYAAVFDHDFQHAADPLDRISYQAFLQEIRKIR